MPITLGITILRQLFPMIGQRHDRILHRKRCCRTSNLRTVSLRSATMQDTALRQGEQRMKPRLGGGNCCLLRVERFYKELIINGRIASADGPSKTFPGGG